MENEGRILGIIAEQLGIPEDEVSTSHSFRRDLGADSLDFLEVLMAVEEEFEIDISENEAEKISTVQELIDYISQHHYS